MAVSERASLTIARLVLVMAIYSCCNGNLQLTMDRSWDMDYCGYLHCWYQDNSNNDISSISEISLYDITRPDVRKLIATYKSDGLGIRISPSSINNVTGNGSIVDLNASLSVSFRSPQDCQLSSFLCELGCVNINNQIETIGVENRAHPSDQCDYGAVNSQLFKMSTQLSALRQDNTNLSIELSSLRSFNRDLSTELSAIKIQYSVLQLQFQNLSSQVSPTQHYMTSVLTSPSKTVTTTSPTTRITTPALGTLCSKGMTHSNPRVKILLWDVIPALCDTETDGGGWVIFQRRTKGDVDFYRDWQSYKYGFSTPDTDFWLGNEAIHYLTSQGYNELRVDITYNNVSYYAHYNVFIVDNEQQNYRLTVSGYNGTAGDSLAYYHSNMTFTTYDRHNDDYPTNCAVNQHGAWWYRGCCVSNLNGAWGVNHSSGLIWYALGGYTGCMSSTEVKVRIGSNR